MRKQPLAELIFKKWVSLYGNHWEKLTPMIQKVALSKTAYLERCQTKTLLNSEGKLLAAFAHMESWPCLARLIFQDIFRMGILCQPFLLEMP